MRFRSTAIAFALAAMMAGPASGNSITNNYNQQQLWAYNHGFFDMAVRFCPIFNYDPKYRGAAAKVMKISIGELNQLSDKSSKLKYLEYVLPHRLGGTKFITSAEEFGTGFICEKLFLANPAVFKKR